MTWTELEQKFADNSIILDDLLSGCCNAWSDRQRSALIAAYFLYKYQTTGGGGGGDSDDDVPTLTSILESITNPGGVQEILASINSSVLENNTPASPQTGTQADNIPNGCVELWINPQGPVTFHNVDVNDQFLKTPPKGYKTLEDDLTGALTGNYTWTAYY